MPREEDQMGTVSVRFEEEIDSGVAGGGAVPSYNAALTTNGATAVATSSANADLQPDKALNGVRNTANHWNAPGSGGGWSSLADPGITPQDFEVTFSGAKTIKEIDVITLADAINYTVDPTLADTFTLYGLGDFLVQYWDGGAWQTISTVSGNNKVWRQFTFAPITTTKVRLHITFANGNAARIVELEAWTS